VGLLLARLVVSVAAPAGAAVTVAADDTLFPLRSGLSDSHD
jgi:hypothetical protein